MIEHINFAKEMQVPHPVQVENGDIVKLSPGDKPEVYDKAPSGRLYLDGNVSVEEDSQSIKDRRNLSSNGYLEITKYSGEILKFGNSNSSLKAVLKIKKPNFTFNLIKGGSIGFAESYMRHEFETNNLPNLIEITARNIKVIYKFSGLLDFPLINFLKNTFIG